MKAGLAIRADVCVTCPSPAGKSGWCPRCERLYGPKSTATVKPVEIPPASEASAQEPAMIATREVHREQLVEEGGRYLSAAKREMVAKVVRRELSKPVRPSVDEVLATVTEECGYSPGKANFYRAFFTPIAKELGVARPRGGDQKTARRAPTPPATVEAAPAAPPPLPPEPPEAQTAALAEDPPQAPAQTVFSAADDLVVVMAQESGRVRLTLSILTTQNEASFLVRQAMQAAMPRQRAVEAL